MNAIWRRFISDATSAIFIALGFLTKWGEILSVVWIKGKEQIAMRVQEIDTGVSAVCNFGPSDHEDSLGHFKRLHQAFSCKSILIFL
jgi:hypothetical protein